MSRVPLPISITREPVPPTVTTNGNCSTYTVADGYDRNGNPNSWRTTTHCGGGGGGKPRGGSGTSVSSGVDTGASVGEASWKHPFADLVGGVTFADPTLMAAEEKRLRREAELAANLGWNAGAHSVATIPANWHGRVSFDVPDVQGARPAGVAVGLAPAAALPSGGRSGYRHLAHGLVFTESALRVVVDGEPRLEIPYATVRAARVGAGTDQVHALLYEGMIKWVVNNVQVAMLPFELSGQVALDATLFKVYDSVDNPRFVAGDWSGEFPGLENGSVNGALGRLQAVGEMAHNTGLVGGLPALAARLSQNPYADIEALLPGLQMMSSYTDGVIAALPSLAMRAYDSSTNGDIEASLGRLGMSGSMGEVDASVTYSVLTASLPRMAMTARILPVITGDLTLPALIMRASELATYGELTGSLGGLRTAVYVSELTPLEYALEFVGCHVPLLPIAYVSLAFVERVDGSSTAVLAAITGVDATEQVGVEDQLTALQTFLADAVEQVGVLERARLVAFDAQGEQGGEAWVVNAATNASTRYDRYGFNSFAAVGGRHFGARADGIYLLEGASDAGRPIKSGIALGQHDFGSQALKNINAVYVGVSSTGALFLKVGDGRTHYTYRARRTDPRMKVQRFDTGRGLRTNYFTFELTSEADAFELDSVTFHVLASQRRI